MAVTLRHIAEAVGVSTMTASRCLRGSGRVDPATRRLIQDAARRLGYFKQHGALTAKSRPPTDRGLRVLLPILQYNANGVESPHGRAVVRGLRARLEETGGRLVMESVTSLADLLAVCKSQRLHAIVLRDQLPEEWIARLRNRYPVIYAVATDSQSGVDCIYTNEHRSASEILRYLSARGHERIVWLGIMDHHTSHEQIPGVFPAIHTHGVRYGAWANITICRANPALQTLMILDRDWRTQSLTDVLREAREKILALSPRPTAIVTPADTIALEMIRVLGEAGLRVPQDISIIGYGGLETHAAHLTTVRMPMELLGRMIPELIERRLADPASLPMSFQLEASLQPGETVADISTRKK